MYTNSLDDEMEFLLALSKSSDDCMKDGECVEVRDCPNCQEGVVITRCVQNEQTKKFEHYCKSCGERFSVSKIKAEVFFNERNWMLKKLETPFGDVSLSLNDKPFEFRYGVFVYENEASKKPVVINRMSVDLSRLKIRDVLTFSFGENILDATFSDDDMVVYSCQNDTSILGFCLYKKGNWYNILDSNNTKISCEVVSCKGSANFALICLDINNCQDAVKKMILDFRNMIK